MNFLVSLRHATHGLVTVWKREPNFRIEIVCGFIVCGASYYLALSRLDWIIVLLLIFAVLLCEIVNSVMEAIIDLLSPRYHALAKQIKDMMAAGTLLMAIASVLVGLWIFIPYLMK